MRAILLIDFGSTYTKLTAVDLDSESVLGTAQSFTTIYTDINDGLENALAILRQKCDEAGLKGIPLVVGGNIVIGKQKFEEVEQRFKDMGFDRAFPPGTAPETTIEALRELLHMDGEQA